MNWKCKYGHIFTAMFADIRQKKTWCSVCRNLKSKKRILEHNRKKKIEIIAKLPKLATDNGGILLSDPNDYKTAQTKLLWKCKNNHKFKSTYSQVGNIGAWCAKCSRGKTEKNIIRHR